MSLLCGNGFQQKHLKEYTVKCNTFTVKYECWIAYKPHSISFLSFGNSIMSLIDVRAPSSVPNMLSNPRVNNMRKKRTDQRGAIGNWLMASVNAIKANPVPEPDCIRKKIKYRQAKLIWSHWKFKWNLTIYSVCSCFQTFLFYKH